MYLIMLMLHFHSSTCIINGSLVNKDRQLLHSAPAHRAASMYGGHSQTVRLYPQHSVGYNVLEHEVTKQWTEKGLSAYITAKRTPILELYTDR